MSRNLFALCVITTFLAAALWADDTPRLDTNTKVAEGVEVAMKAVEVTADTTSLNDGRSIAVLKAGKATKVKMPAQAWTLGFTGTAAKGGGIRIETMDNATALSDLRLGAGKGGACRGWAAERGDIITHANGYSVNSFEELLVAVSTAKDPMDVQIVLNDVNIDKPVIFYVTALKRLKD